MEQQEKKARKERRRWVILGLWVSLAAACCFAASFGFFHREVLQTRQSILETPENMGWLYQNTYLLYRQLYNQENGTSLDYQKLYGSSWEEMQAGLVEEGLGAEQAAEIATAHRTDFKNVFSEMEDGFAVLNNCYGYQITDDKTGYSVTNLSQEALKNLKASSRLLISFTFDSYGNVTVGQELVGQDTDGLYRMAQQAAQTTLRLEDVFAGSVKGPVDCTVTYAASAREWEANDVCSYDLGVRDFSIWEREGEMRYYAAYDRSGLASYRETGMSALMALFVLAVFLSGLFLPLGGFRPWQETALCRLSAEAAFCFAFLYLPLSEAAAELAAFSASHRMLAWLGELFSKQSGGFVIEVVNAGVNLLVYTAFFFAAWYLGVCLRALRQLGLAGYLRERSLLCRGCAHLYRKGREQYLELTHIDLTQSSLRKIRRLVGANGLLLALICLTWMFGPVLIAIYSLLLYVFLKRYVGELQKRYGILHKAIDEIAEGNLDVEISGDMGVFESFRPQIEKLQKGFRKAVEEEVKSQRMKAELITNVSHDLKTPLTAIITYVGLLKDPELTEEKRGEYLAVMEQKSLRLKALIEDLFEVSKANSGNVILNPMPVDLVSLLKQVCFEMQDKFSGAGLDVRVDLGREKLVLSLDSQKTYRIYENLFSNVAKYAMKGTRVYVNGFQKDDTFVIVIKNISEQELTVDSAELTERFVRGDASRNTEGSGLGLAIAKSFMEVQGGRLEIEMDGDLFKASTVWTLNR